MWPRQSHTSAPLTRLMSTKSKCKWAQFKQYAFDKIKQIVACDTLSNYPDFDEMFKIHTHAIAF